MSTYMGVCQDCGKEAEVAPISTKTGETRVLCIVCTDKEVRE